MYKRILVPLENTPTDRVIIDHVRRLAHETGAHVLLLHVADGFVARYYRDLNLRESEEMVRDRAYLEQVAAELAADGVDAEPVLGAGNPAVEIAATAEREHCDLIAMATHGHKWLADLFHGTTATEVRHRTRVPVLMVRA